MPKKILLLVAVVLAIAAAGAPASAFANWTHEGVEITEEVEGEMLGPAKWEVKGIGGGAQFELDKKWRLYLFPPTTGEYHAVKVTNCISTGGFAGLRCTGAANGLPWVFHWGLFSGFTVTGVSFSFTYYAATDVSHTKPLFHITVNGDVRAVPDNPIAMSSVSLEGEGMTANGNSATFSGELEITPAETYGGE